MIVVPPVRKEDFVMARTCENGKCEDCPLLGRSFVDSLSDHQASCLIPSDVCVRELGLTVEDLKSRCSFYKAGYCGFYSNEKGEIYPWSVCGVKNSEDVGKRCPGMRLKESSAALCPNSQASYFVRPIESIFGK